MKFIVKTLLVNIAFIAILFIGISVMHPETTPEQDVELTEMFVEIVLAVSPVIWGIALGRAFAARRKRA